MGIRSTLFRIGGLVALAVLGQFFLHAQSVDAATCTITTATVINQAYVTANSCTAINIQGNVSTTWNGTVDLGGGTVTVKSGYTMTMGSSSQMILGANDDFVIESNATTTHLAEDPYGVQISARNITVSGKIYADGIGCRGGVTANTTNGGWGPSLSTGVCTANTSGYGKGRWGGAAHGGYGGSPNLDSSRQTTTYGAYDAPTFLGSGGATWSADNAVAGAGGGRIQLTVSGTLTVSGSVSANGLKGTSGGGGNGSGGGSGGSVYIIAPTVAGSGTITANGGAASAAHGGGGGGGRIALYYQTNSGMTFTNVTAWGGSLGSALGEAGEAGTTFILDRLADDGSGNLYIPSGLELLSGGDYSRTSITIGSGARLRCATQTTLSISATTITDGGSQFYCDNAITDVQITATTFNSTSTMWRFTNASTYVLTATSWNPGTNSSTFIMSKTGAHVVWSLGSATTFTQFRYVGPYAGTSSGYGGILQIPLSGALSFVSSTFQTSVSSTQLTSLSVDANTTLTATSRGCQGGANTNGYGPNSQNVCTVSTAGYGKRQWGGGAHGGAGGTGALGEATAQTTTYDSQSNPSLFGAGGGSSGETGGIAGGLIRFSVSGAFVNNGIVSANGSMQPVFNYGSSNGTGGPSGGSIYISAGSISGAGSFAAQGAAGSGYGGGGGGGRIAFLYSSTLTFSGTSSTSGGAQGHYGGLSTAGSVGTIYVLQVNQSPSSPASLGPTGLVNGSTTGTNTPTFTFTLSDADVSDTVKFEIQIDDASDFSSVAVDYTSALGAQGAFSFRVGQATGSGTYSTGSSGQTLSDGSYYWRVKAIDQNSAASSYVTANSGAVAFRVDTAARTVSFQYGSGSGIESLTSTSVRIVLNTTHFEAVTVDYSVNASLSTATGSGEDFTLAAGTATISIGETSTTIPLAIINDDIDEANETVRIELAAPSNASLGATDAFVYTIEDNDSAGVSLSKTTASATEGGATDSFTIELTSQPTSTVQIVFTTSTYGATFSTGTIAFTSANWNTPVTVTVSATNDSVDEADGVVDTVTAALSVPVGSAYGYDGVTISDIAVTLADDDVAGVMLSKSTVTVTEGGTTDSYTLVLDSQPTSTIRIAFSTSTYGVTLNATTLDFTSENWNTPQTITVTATNDEVDEPSPATSAIESLVSMPSGYAYGYGSVTIANVSATITDDDEAGITSSRHSIGVTEGGSSQSLTYVLNSAPTSTVTLTFTTSTNGITVSPETMEFTPSNWNTPQSLTILATDDSVYESTHATTVEMMVSGSAYAYATVTPPTVTITITDNEVSDIALSRTTLTIIEGSTGSFTFVLGAKPTSTVTIIPAAGNRITSSPASLIFTPSVWNVPQTVTVSATDNIAYSATDLTSSLTFAVETTTDFASVVIPSVSVTITEDDPPPSGGGVGAFAVPIPLPIPIPLPKPVPLPSTPVPTPSAPISTMPLVPIDVNLNGAVVIDPKVVERLSKDLGTYGVRASAEQKARLEQFVQAGASPVTASLGLGERRALVRDALETMRRADIPLEDLERMAQGQIPKTRNLAEEQKQAARALPTFKTIYGHAPNFSNAEENLAWNTLMYRIRFPRDLELEKRGIGEFQARYGRNPSDPFQWATVRVMGYVDR